MTRSEMNIIKKRILDIGYGAGYIWDHGNSYFDMQNGLTSVANMIVGLEQAFDLPDDNWLRLPWNLEKMEDLDTLTDLVIDVIVHEREKKHAAQKR